MKKSNKMIAMLIAIIGMAVCILVGCAMPKVLETPKNLQVSEEGILTWDAVENASSYLVEIDGMDYEVESNQMDIFRITDKYKTYEITVTAYGDLKTYEDSSASETFEYTLTAPKGKLYYRSINEGTEWELMINYLESEAWTGKVILPGGEYQGKPITGLKVDMFRECMGITSVLIPDSIVNVGQSAFMHCENLKRVELSPWTEEIEDGTFSYCKSLTTCNIPEYVEKIGAYAFGLCNLSKVYFPKSLSELELSVFMGNPIAEISVDEENETYFCENNCLIERETNTLVLGGNQVEKIPSSVTCIRDDAFSGRLGLKEITISGTVKEIQHRAFLRCTDLERVTIEEGVEIFGKEKLLGSGNVFWQCDKLTELYFPASMKIIGPINGCANLVSLEVDEKNPFYRSEGNCIIRKSDNHLVAGCKTSVIPEGIKVIDPYAFSECYLTSLTSLPESVEEIERFAFYGNNLTQVVLPKGVKKIGKGAFSGNNSSSISVIAYDTLETIELHGFVRSCLYIVGDWNSNLDWNASNFGDDLMNAIFGCQVAYDGEVPYVYAIDWRTDKRMIDSISSKWFNVPVREGYRFLGWATEEGSQEVVYGVVKVSKEANNDSLFEPGPHDFTKGDYYVSLCPTKGCTLPKEDTMLYAVWEKIEEKNEG